MTLIEGYDEARRRDLAARLTDAAISAIGAPVDGTTVLINEVAAANYMRGRTSRTPGTPPAAPARVVRDYLGAMEQRNIETATALLAPEFTMTFPGGAVFCHPEALADWAKKSSTLVGLVKLMHGNEQLQTALVLKLAVQ